MGALCDWLEPMSLDEFRTETLGVRPFARPSTASSARSACSWQALERILASEAKPDVLVVSRGRALDIAPPRSLRDLRALFTQGIGVVVRDAERVDATLERLAAGLLEDVPGEARVLVFATPEGTHGFGWHYDAEEVFIAQTEGDKEYYLQANTIDPNPRRGAQPDFETHRRERTPRMSCRLVAGDWLYIPRGYWHVAHPHEDSLSVSIGIYPSGA